MAGKDLSLKIAVKLLTKNFKSGINTVTASIRSLTSHFMAYASALGAGAIGMSNFISKMREVAKETTSANIALKNVSGTAAEYGSNMGWLQKIASKYGVQINTLTMSFAKFKSAADIASMSAEDQRKIFESVARASVAYGMSAEDQRGVFMALQQMMSKGKVMAEELRLQLAERIPVAIQAMAKATGVSVNELDKMMKQGKVLSLDVLPRFAAALNEMIPNVDTNNLNKSLNDLSNTFVELTKKLNIEGRYKSIVEMVDRLLQNLLNNTKRWAIAIGGAFYLYIANKVRGLGKFFIAESDKTVKGLMARQKALDSANANEVAKKAAMEAAKERYAQARSEREVLYEQASVEAKIKLSERELKAKLALEKAEKQYNNAVLAAQQQQAQFDKEKPERDLANASAWVKMTHGMKAAGVQLLGVLKSLGSAILWNAAIAGAMALATALGHALVKFIKIRNIVKNTQKELDKPAAMSSSEVDLQADLKVLKTSKDEAAREGALKRINSLLGSEFKYNELNAKKLEEINAKAQRYIAYLRAQAELEKARALVQENLDKANAVEGAEHKVYKDKYGRITGEVKNQAYLEKQNYLDAAALARRSVDKWAEEVAKGAKEFMSSSTFDGNSGAGAPDEDSLIKKASDRYAESLNDLSAQLALGLMTQKEYERAKRDLIEKTRAEILASGDAGLMGSDFASGIANAFGTFSHGELRDREEEAVDMIDEYNAELEAQNRALRAGTMSEQEYAEAVTALTKKIYEQIVAMDTSGFNAGLLLSLGATGNSARQLNSEQLGKLPAQQRRGREVSPVSVAMMRGSERLAYDLETAQEELSALRDQATSAIGGMVDEISAKESQITSLKEALAIEETKEALKDLNRQIASGSWNVLESGVSAVDGLISSVQNLKEVMNSDDSSGWDKFMAGFDILSASVQGILSVIEAIETLSTAIKALRAVKETEQAMEKKEATETIGMNTAEAASEAGKSAAKAFPFPWNIVAIGGAIAAAIAAFSALPKFAKGGVVGGNSTQGDKVLARLNSGEGVLTQDGMANLARLAGARASAAPANIHITGRLTASGRDLELVLDRQQRYNERIG